ncbi:MarR family winged helix-turn-helix transcriptional regulator [Aestuariivirga litoralis]|uniref:MarR family winged helix-turn-helix transcriptional regulator n=1 Tax=Aestuariivirga litoralis TaxID=2650924 RepID=UPI0018C53CA3|nr:MarR family transcriptional regulator [Aestuariivirga litoralis]MBG1232133.1 MarR family transcriptional regulator [Aestuariivirga litoralis]
MSANPPIPPIGNMMCFSVYAAGLAFNRLYRGLLEQFGLTYPQFLVLVALSGRDSQKVNELGEALFLESNTLTPLLKRLEAMGHITRRRDAKDERVVRIHLTGKGQVLIGEIGCVPPQVLEASSLPLAEAQALTAKINTLAQALRAHSQTKTT